MTILIYLGAFNIIAAIVAIAWLETRPAARREREAIRGLSIGRETLLTGIVSCSEVES